ncbi:MAG TPA: NAD(P)/FAD-dependent oxidoreductase [Afifellaceae bacterium]|nr:NAD(P)/FAD-dependent oxidoreductase [Afifellaceae bacterium]
MTDFDATIVGAGVVGLAVARELALAGRSVLILEAAGEIGSETSSRNSEVIHGGLYYPPGSLKSRLCVPGKHRLYRYLAERGVGHSRLGKLVVAATADEAPALERLAARGAENGVDDLQLLTAAQARKLEPELRCAAALLSPSTGIFDSHGYMLALLGDAEAAGAAAALRTPFERAEPAPGGFRVHAGGAEPTTFTTAMLVNAAGLRADHVAAAIEGLPAEHVPKLRYAKGSYFVLSGRSPFSRLIYPLPSNASLGLHLALDMGGQTRFGPDVEWVERLDYDVDPARASVFYGEVRRYWPGLADGALSPGYSGIRPKLVGPGEPPADFRIDGPEAHGVAGLVNLFGIESPGLTASLAIADEVRRRLEG